MKLPMIWCHCVETKVYSSRSKMAVVNVKVAAKRQYWKSAKKNLECNDEQSHEKGHYLAAMADVGQVLANK